MFSRNLLLVACILSAADYSYSALGELLHCMFTSAGVRGLARAWCSLACTFHDLPHVSPTELHSLDPLEGSIAGGTRVYVHGSGFSTDSYTGSNLVFFGDIPCDVVWYTVTARRLECITRPYPGAVEGMSSLPLQARVISGGVQVIPTTGSTKFAWSNYHTPQVENSAVGTEYQRGGGGGEEEGENF